jgi:membrane-associated HD superfamily phosphohydrolase
MSTAVQTRTTGTRERYAWIAGIVFVIALLAESVVSTGVGLTHHDSAAKIAAGLHEHRDRLLLVAYVSAAYAVTFVVYLCCLYNLLRQDSEWGRILGHLVLIGGVLFVALHAVSDIGITGLLGAKLATFSYQHDQGLAYMLYLMTYAVDSVGDVFGSLAAVVVGLLVMKTRLLPRWLGWVSILAGILFFFQGFGLGGVIATFGLVLDLIAFVLFLTFVLASSIVLLTRGETVRSAAA